MIDILLDIRSRCGVYLNGPSIANLDIFLRGYLLCRLRLTGQKYSFLPMDFLDYLADAGVCNEINPIPAFLEMCNGDDEAAFWLFYEKYDEFLASTKETE